MPTRGERLGAFKQLRSQRRVLLIASVLLAVVAVVLGTATLREEGAVVPIGTGEASYYGPGFAGNLTANGEIFDPEQFTAAHRTLPMDSHVQVTNPANGQSVIVRINDRGPYHDDRVIDLSVAAARELDLIRAGTARVELELIQTEPH